MERLIKGLPLYNCAVYVLNSAGEPVERGQIGEIFVSGPYVTSKLMYPKSEHLNNIANFVDNPLQSEKKGNPKYF